MKIRARRAAGLALTCLLSAPLATAQQPATDDLKKEIEAVKDSLKTIQKDIQEIKAMLQSRPGAAPQNIVLELGKNDVKGAKDAKLTLIEFTDYQ